MRIGRNGTMTGRVMIVVMLLLLMPIVVVVA
jgi:hypothetical protein